MDYARVCMILYSSGVMCGRGEASCWRKLRKGPRGCEFMCDFAPSFTALLQSPRDEHFCRSVRKIVTLFARLFVIPWSPSPGGPLDSLRLSQHAANQFQCACWCRMPKQIS